MGASKKFDNGVCVCLCVWVWGWGVGGVGGGLEKFSCKWWGKT